ncbi:hypothetical protein FD754_011763 [Muntiacus muntjak]|uniref:Homeobox domain-containing protein n=1 Tax=Muntiacus muntjak TaxID=9888 RepID=A0A5N3VFC0_MUNMU|nr:hypothetical protein FD754_011763 [Muntiacus muntjak]
MSVDPACPQSLLGPKASNSRESSPMPEESYASLQIPDSSTSPRVKPLPPSAEESTEKEENVPVKKRKMRTVFSQTQLCVKIWFQNQRMKCKKWQKNNWPRNSNGMGVLVNSPGNLPMWGNQTWNNPTWTNQSWNTWNNQPWNNQFNNYMEQPRIQLQQNSPICDLEATLGTAGENYNVIQQTVKYFSSQQQNTDLFPNYPLNIQPEDL